MKIVDLKPNMDDAMLQCADLLVTAFKDLTPAWPNLAAGRAEVEKAFGPGKVNRLLMDKDQVLGWVGAQALYHGKVWEIHPLAVRPDQQGQSYGRLLLQDIESQAIVAGIATLWVGTDDEAGLTSLSQENLYDNVSKSIATVKNFKRHPFEFYQKCGFTITGVLPDANGPGKPDIFLAKKVREMD